MCGASSSTSQASTDVSQTAIQGVTAQGANTFGDIGLTGANAIQLTDIVLSKAGEQAYAQLAFADQYQKRAYETLSQVISSGGNAGGAVIIEPDKPAVSPTVIIGAIAVVTLLIASK